jgi:hypothetical protein
VSGTVTVGMEARNTTATPVRFTLTVDGTPVFDMPVSATTASFAWNTQSVIDGALTLVLTVRDALDRPATLSQSVTVRNAPTVTIAATDASATEAGPTTGTFTVSRTGNTAGPLTVAYTTGGTATAGSDYVALSGSVTIPAGAASAAITVTPINDTLVEPNETVIVTLAANSAYTVGTPASATVTVASDDGAPPGEIIIDNGTPGATFTGTWCVSGVAGAFGANSLFSCGTGVDTYRWTPSIAAAGTYDVYVWWTVGAGRSTTVPITVTHAAGSTTAQFNQRLAGGQWNLHGRYTFNAGTGGFVQTTDANGQASADAVRFVPVGGGAALPTVTIAATDGTATEVGPTTGALTVTRTGSTTAALTVAYTVSGTATAGGDYAALSGGVTIPAGATSAPITVTPIDDTVVEPNETVIVTLAANSAYTVGTPASATVTITSNDAMAPSTEIIIDNGTAGATFTGTWCASGAAGAFGANSLFSCGTGLDTYRWTPSIPAAGTYDVYVWWTAGTGRSTTAPITVSHAAGSTTVQFNQRLAGGQWNLHGRYAFNAGTGGFVQISDVNGQASADAVRFVPAGGGGPTLPTVTVAATDAAATEAGPTTGTIAVTRTGSTTSALTVLYTVGGTATAGSDYVALSGTVTIPAGAASATITVTPINDTLVEPSETAIVTLAANSAYAVGSPASATVTITSDDGGGAPAEIIIDNGTVGATFTGTWCTSGAAGAFGANSLFSCGGGLDTYRWTPSIPSAGTYDVYVWWTVSTGRSTTVPFTVSHAAGSTTMSFNQRVSGGQWVLHGRYTFNAGTGGFVQTTDQNGQASADAVRFVPAPSPTP